VVDAKMIESNGNENAYGLETSTEENRKGHPGFPTIYEQK